MKLRFLTIFIFLTLCGFTAEPGFSLNFDGSGGYGKLGEVLKDTRTISFWFKPNYTIGNSGGQLAQTFLMRDANSKSLFWEGETGIFIEGSGSTDAGKIVFRCSSPLQSYEVVSDRDEWKSNVWYHVAAVVHPTEGLMLFINGVKQSDTEPLVTEIYTRNEGPTGVCFLGKWNTTENYFLNCELEELCFYDDALTTTEIREQMCKVKTGITMLKDYYQFNSKSVNSLTSTGTASGTTILYNVLYGDYKKSSAPVGQASTYLYPGLWSAQTLGMTMEYSIAVDSIQSLADGMHIYYNYDNSNPAGPLNRGVFGVWFTDPQSQYSVEIDFHSLSPVCDSCAFLQSRDDPSKSGWHDRSGYLGNCRFRIEQESMIARAYREEYRVIDSLELELGLDDTVVACSGERSYLSPNSYPGATYVWDDTVHQQILLVDQPGYHTVEVDYKGCRKEQMVYVEIHKSPEFQLPRDTAICEGDTLWLTAPIDSAQYLWIGFFTGRKFAITAAGTYNLIITKGKCSHKDEITVDIIPKFSFDLGPDTLLCLGQTYTMNLPQNGVNYSWNDGSDQTSRELFNAPGTYWVYGWNRCFEHSDTIRVDYEECDCEIYIPNSFTPNGDQVNDLFHPVTGCYYEEFDLDIQNRWGEIVYKMRSLEDGWDGTFRGQPAPEGVYTYRIKYKKYSWQAESKYDYGTFNLIR